MRIAFFVQYSHAAGTYFRWHNLAIALKKLGHEVDVYAGDHNWQSSKREEIKDGIQYYIVPSFITARFLGNPNDPISGIKRLFNLPKQGYDVYHLFQPFIHAYIPWKYLKLKKKQSVFLYDWDDLWTGGFFTAKPKSLTDWSAQHIVKYLEKNVPEQADGSTMCSLFLANKIDDKHLKGIIYNGFWSKPLQDKQALRKKWNLEEDIFYLAYVGKTAQEMGWIAAAMHKIKSEKYKHIKLIVCGPPKQVLIDLNMLDNPSVIYLGEVSSIEAAEICTASDLGLVPLDDSDFNKSRFPIKFFDFLSVGTPVYLSNVGEVARIGQAIKGVYLGSSNEEEWSGQLGDVIESIQQSNEVIDVAHLENNYSWPALSANLIAFYQKTKAAKQVG